MEGKASGGRIALSLLVIVFICFLAFQVSRNLGDKMSTVDATYVTVEDRVSADAVFIRNQTVVYGKQGAVQFLVKNGEKVSANQNVCIFFDSAEASSTYDKLQAVNDSIAALKYTDSIVVDANDSVKLDRVIYSQIKDLMDNINDGSAVQIDKDYTTLSELISVRNAGTYDQAATNFKISQLEAEASGYRNALSRSSNIVKVKKAGYFITAADGFENVFSTSCIDSLDPDSLHNGIAQQESVSDTAVGSLVDDFYWYMAIEADREQTALYTGMKNRGTKVKTYFSALSTAPLELEVYRINRGSGDKSVIIFKSNVMAGEYLSTRFQTVDVVLDTYSGIKIPHEALHQKDGEWGVYCLDGAKIKFKPAKIIYQAESYYLLEMAESSSKGVYIYDKIILGGVGIE